MGFPSLAKDYEENRIDWNEIMVPRSAATLFVPTDDGFVLIDKSIKPKVDDIIYFKAFFMRMIGRRFSRSTHEAQKNTANHLKTASMAVCGLRYVSVKPCFNLNQLRP